MILLLGEYSSVHSELAVALKSIHEDVVLMSDGDGYKKIGCDVKLPELKVFKPRWLNKLINLFRLTGIFGVKNYFNVKKEIEKVGGVEIVQIVNPVVIPSLGAVGNILLIRFLRKRSSIFSLCALGDDYTWVSACLNGKFKYSAMDRMRDAGILDFEKYLYSLKYIYSPLYRFLDFYARKEVDVIIPGLLDYKIAYGDHKKMAQIIPLPISLGKFSKPKQTKYPVKIFHSWQIGKESKKGNDVLDEIIKKYFREYGAEKIIYEIASNLPYEEYLKKFEDSDIFLDQLYSYDRGVSGVLGMASGKVVFSGFEEGNSSIGINATPDKSALYDTFVKLINNLNDIDRIKCNAYEYAKINHDSIAVAHRYLDAWRAVRVNPKASSDNL